MDARNYLSKNLKTIRALRGLSQTAFASEIGVSQSTLQDIENGRGCNLATAECIARSLNMPVAALLSDNSSEDAPVQMVQGVFQNILLFQTMPYREQQRILRTAKGIIETLERSMRPPDPE